MVVPSPDSVFARLATTSILLSSSALRLSLLAALLVLLAAHILLPTRAFADEEPPEDNHSPSVSAAGWDPRSLPETVLTWTPPGHVAPLEFGLLVDAGVAVGRSEVTTRQSGFEIGDARLRLIGHVEHGFSYLLQANLIDRPALLDAQIDWTAERTGTKLSVGYFRTPTSGELAIAAPNLDFLDRASVVRALTPGRQIGLQINQNVLGSALVARAGVFNGNGLNANSDNQFLYTLRFDGVIRTPGAGANAPNATARTGENVTDSPGSDSTDGARWVYGFGGAYSKDEETRLGLDLPAPFFGTRWLAGADLRWESGPVFVMAEGLYSSVEIRNASRRDLYGYQASIGYQLNDLVQLLARYDALYAGSLASDRDYAIASVNLSFGQYVFLQSDLRVPTRGTGPTPGGVLSLSVQY